jgi:hypothetical protein
MAAHRKPTKDQRIAAKSSKAPRTSGGMALLKKVPKMQKIKPGRGRRS